MKSADNPAATENTIDSMIFSSQPANTKIPMVTDKMKKIVIMEYKLNKIFKVVIKITTKATPIEIPIKNKLKISLNVNDKDELLKVQMNTCTLIGLLLATLSKILILLLYLVELEHFCSFHFG